MVRRVLSIRLKILQRDLTVCHVGVHGKTEEDLAAGSDGKTFERD